MISKLKGISVDKLDLPIYQIYYNMTSSSSRTASICLIFSESILHAVRSILKLNFQ